MSRRKRRPRRTPVDGLRPADPDHPEARRMDLTSFGFAPFAENPQVMPVLTREQILAQRIKGDNKK